MFFVDTNDKGLSIMFKREANEILASLDEKSNEYISKKEKFNEVLTVIKAIESTNPQSEENIDFILNTINRLWNIGILSPLTLKDNEFYDYTDSNGYRHNDRYFNIYIDKDNNICNNNAFNISIRAVYSHDNNKQVKHNQFTLEGNHRLYISKGGVITGEYVEKCIIRPEIVDKHCFTIQSVVNIPVCDIVSNNFIIHCVDHREPKLKVLQQFYDMPINKDYNIATSKCNIRKYKKLK